MYYKKNAYLCSGTHKIRNIDMKHLPSIHSFRLFLLSALLSFASTLFAAEYYGIKIGGVAVNSENWNNVTGSTIQKNEDGKQSYVWYNHETKTVTLVNVKIIRTENDERAIFNESCEGLTVRLLYNNVLSSEKAAPVRLQKNTTIEVLEGSTTITGGSEDGIYITGTSVVDIIGSGTLEVNANSSTAIEGKNTSDLATVNFMGPDVTLYGKEGCLVDLNVTFNKTYTRDGTTVMPQSMVTLKPSYDYKEPSVQNCPITLHGTPVTKILEPWGAYIKNKNIMDETGVIYSREILIGNRYKALITEDYFPDSKFREQLVNKFPKHYITDEDISQCKTLDLKGKGIMSLVGITYFTALEILDCSLNYGLTTLNLSANTALKELSCECNGMTSLVIGDNPNLQRLTCTQNKLSTLNVSKCTGLLWLSCYENQLRSLDLSANKKLSGLRCDYNKLTSLDLTNNPALTDLNVAHNQLSSLPLSKQTELRFLYCNDNQLNVLNLDNQPKLEWLDCNNNNLTSLDCSNKTSLDYIFCNNNQLTLLDVSGCTKLSEINCEYNSFQILNVNNLPEIQLLNCIGNEWLKVLNCYENPLLTEIWMSGLTSLQTLDCHACALTKLSIPNTTNLRQLTCYMNKIKDTKMDELVENLGNRNGNSPGTFAVKINAGWEQNVCTEQQAMVAMGKNWNVTYENGQPIYGSLTPTAVNSIIVSQQQPTYNLQGQRVDTGYKGIVITNGKKHLNP